MPEIGISIALALRSSVRVRRTRVSSRWYSKNPHNIRNSEVIPMKAFAIVSSGVAVLGLWSASALAQQPKQTVDDLPGPLESVKELQNSARMVFVLADENNDGQISQKRR